MHIFKFLTTFLWVTTERSINRFGPKKTGFFRSGCQLPMNRKSRQPVRLRLHRNLAEKPDQTGLLNTTKLDAKGDNWAIFLVHFMDAVEAKGFWGHFDSTEPSPVTTSSSSAADIAAKNQWDKDEHSAKTLLTQ